MRTTRYEILSKIRNMNAHNHISIPYKRAILFGLLSLSSTCIALISPYLYKLLVDKVLTEGEIGLLKIIIPLMILVYIIQMFISLISIRNNIKFSNEVSFTIKSKIFNIIINRNISGTLNMNVGEYQKLIEQDCNIITNFILDHIVGFACSFIYVIVYFAFMFYISPFLALISTILIPISILFGRYMGKKFNQYNKKLYEIGAENNSFLFNTIQKWREVKAQTIEELLFKRYEKKLKPEQENNIKWMRFYALNNLFYALKNDFIQSLLLYCIGGLLIINGQITVGGLLMFMSYTNSFSVSLDSIISSITSMSSDKAAYDRLFKVCETSDFSKNEKPDSAFDIQFENVDFSYAKDLPNILNKINYKFEFGKKYLIVGKSGDGKSTLLKLILCLNQPCKGLIKINEKNILDICEQDYFKNIGAVMQDTNFFNLSIKENLKLIAPQVTEDDIKTAMTLVHLDEFIDTLPDKYDTIIGERGVKLSGGQKQRLAIARLLLHNPNVMIFDEATSALDAITESDILENLNSKFENKTVIFISHKTALQIEFDEIIKIKDGPMERLLHE